MYGRCNCNVLFLHWVDSLQNFGVHNQRIFVTVLQWLASDHIRIRGVSRNALYKCMILILLTRDAFLNRITGHA